jgi:hypothetical protein
VEFQVNTKLHKDATYQIRQYTNQFIIALYHIHIHKIEYIRERMKSRNHADWRPQFDDTEAEITSLLLLYFQPEKVIEFSPCAGWSSSIMLDAMAFNQNMGVLTSYDLDDHCLSNLVPNEQWQFVQGDVQKRYSEWDLSSVDYLFIDSDHSREFAENYVELLLKPLLNECRSRNMALPVSVHDVFHGALASSEGEVVIDFLSDNGLNYYTAACAKENYLDLVKIKSELGFDEVIHQSWGREELGAQANSAIFFILS